MGRGPDLAMLCVQAKPINHNLPSSGELLNNCIMKTTIMAKIPVPRFSNYDHVCEELKYQQNKQKGYYDKTAHDLPPLVPGQKVHVLDHQKE